jgi:hypothetical protein
MEESKEFLIGRVGGVPCFFSPTNLSWLPGWWKVGTEFYFVTKTGHGYSTPHAPRRSTDQLFKHKPDGYYFDKTDGLIFTWKKLPPKIRVERWTAPTNGTSSSVQFEGVTTQAERVFR